MPLTLRITSPERQILGPDSTRVFSVHGGSIGRAPDNDWTLPDPHRYISAHHALIDYQGGGYYITDLSTNGVFVNDSDQPVGQGAPLRLYDGDRVRMGKYLFKVSIVNISDEGAGDTAVFVADDAPEPESDKERDPTDTVVEDELGLNLRMLAAEDDEEDEDDFSVIEEATSLSGSWPIQEDETGVVDSTQQVARIDPERARDALEVILDAAGANIAKVPEGDEQTFLGTIGYLVRASAQGLLDVLRARTQIKGSMGLSQTSIQPAENNPLKFAKNVDEALDELLFYKGIHYMPAVDAVEEAFVDVRAHQKAVVVAMREAFFELLKRFDPQDLEKTFNKGLRRGALLGMSNKAKFWDLYRDHYRSVSRASDKDFDEMVGRVFSEAYEAEIRRLTGQEQKKTQQD